MNLCENNPLENRHSGIGNRVSTVLVSVHYNESTRSLAQIRYAESYYPIMNSGFLTDMDAINKNKTLFEYSKDIYTNLINSCNSPLNNEIHQKIRKLPLEKLVKDKNECWNFIKSMYEFPNEFIPKRKSRASHILITWLLGIGIENAFHFSDYLSNFGRTFYEILWLQTAICHDYGYFLDDKLKDRFLTIGDLTKKYDLLSSKYSDEFLKCLNGIEDNNETEAFFTYTYDEIRNYFEYSQFYHSKNKGNDEYNDHGIVGGCSAFAKFCKHIRTSPIIMGDFLTKIQKIACYITATHNIFKSSSSETDDIYRSFCLYDLLTYSSVRVTEINWLLLLLSLIDTIECTKRFSQRENKKSYLQQRTVLDRIDIVVSEKKITLDFNRLHQFIINNKKNDEMSKKLWSHIEAIADLKTWTSLNSFKTSDYSVCISIN